jgi:hypothetical protein
MTKNFVWNAVPIVKPEFRLYYDDTGRVLFYTCEKPPGTYIVVDAQTFAEARPDVRVVDGKITTVVTGSVVTKLVEADVGTKTVSTDISVIPDKKYRGKVTKWKPKTHVT